MSLDEADRDYAKIGDPGTYPYTRGRMGPPAARRRGWIHRELSGEGSPRRSNEQLRDLLARGALGIDVIGDNPTMSALDPDHPMCIPAVGTTGVSLCRKQDFIELVEGIPLDEITLSHSLPPAFALAGQYLASPCHGIDPRVLRGSAIQPPLYSEDCSYSTFLPFETRMRLTLDSIVFALREMPRFHAFLEDTYYISDGGLNAVEEMSLGLLEIREVCRRLLARGLPVDSFAPRIAILVNCRMDLFEEIAKIRATRRMFARMMREEFGATDPRSWSVNIAVHTSGLTLTAAQPANNIVRGAVQALAMAMAGVQGLEISTFDEPFRTPSAIAHQTAIRTQQVIQTETNITAVEDPLGGSWYLESLTDELERRIDAAVRQMEALGDVGTLVESGYFRNIFLHGMDRHSRAVQSGELRIVGVNEHVIAPEDDRFLRDIAEQRFEPDYAQVESDPRLAPHPRRRAAAGRPRARTRRIGRPRRRPHGPDRRRPRRGRHHRRDHRLPPGGPGAAGRPVRVRRPAPAARDPDMTGPAPGPSAGSGRPGRIVIGTLGLDQHEVGAMAISRILIRHGYEVIYLGRFNTPERLTAVAEQEDADLVGVSIHSWEYAAYADELVARCRELGIGLVLGGSVLTERDQADLLRRGADAVFGPYASEATMLRQIDAVVRRVRAGDPPARLTKRAARSPAVRAAGRADRHRDRRGARARPRLHPGAVPARRRRGRRPTSTRRPSKRSPTPPGTCPAACTRVVCDVTGPDAPRTLLDAALRRYGQLHGLVSNAGLLRSGPILQLDDERPAPATRGARDRAVPVAASRPAATGAPKPRQAGRSRPRWCSPPRPPGCTASAPKPPTARPKPPWPCSPGSAPTSWAGTGRRSTPSLP